ncbi:MAG TPA: hypothetical protein VI039_06875 [Solirubrobacterales bacterium]
MKHLKILGLLGVVVSAFAFAPGASATTITDGNTQVYTGDITATSESAITLHGVADLTCAHAHFTAKVESHGSGVTAKGPMALALFNCDQHPFIIKAGTFEIHWTNGSNGTLTWSGGQITVEFTTIFGNVHCVFGTNNTHFGTITAPSNHSSHATLDLDSAPIPIESGSFLCGSSAEATGRFTITKPIGLTVDQ